MSQNLYVKKEVPFELYEINTGKYDKHQLTRISEEMGLALNLNEMLAIQKYFSQKNRNPTDVELQTLGQTWSEHCFHKTFKGIIMTPEVK